MRLIACVTIWLLCANSLEFVIYISTEVTLMTGSKFQQVYFSNLDHLIPYRDRS